MHKCVEAQISKLLEKISGKYNIPINELLLIWDPEKEVVEEEQVQEEVVEQEEESKQEEEADWISKNKPYLKTHGVLGENVPKDEKELDKLAKTKEDNDDDDITYKDPLWLKGKADDLFRSGDIRSAINVYGDAIKFFPGLFFYLKMFLVLLSLKRNLKQKLSIASENKNSE